MFPQYSNTPFHRLRAVWFVTIYWLYVVLADDVILCGALLDCRLDSLYRVAIVRQRSKCSMSCQLCIQLVLISNTFVCFGFMVPWMIPQDVLLLVVILV